MRPFCWLLAVFVVAEAPASAVAQAPWETVTSKVRQFTVKMPRKSGIDQTRTRPAMQGHTESEAAPVRHDTPALGELPPEGAARDAVHIAVCPMIAGEDLSPGDHVGFGMESRRDRVWKTRVNAVGVADPFLTAPVRKGQRFWLFLYPGTVTSLRHAWTHPKFPDEEAARD